jgi:hypothetical protein
MLPCLALPLLSPLFVTPSLSLTSSIFHFLPPLSLSLILIFFLLTFSFFIYQLYTFYYLLQHSFLYYSLLQFSLLLPLIDFAIRAAEGKKKSLVLKAYTNKIRTDNEQFKQLLRTADAMAEKVRVGNPSLVSEFKSLSKPNS